jgi:hypothetical protein
MTWRHNGATCGTWRMWPGPLQRVRPPMATIPPPNERSAGEDSDGGATLPFRTPTDRVMDLPWFGQYSLHPPSLFLLILGHPLQ